MRLAFAFVSCALAASCSKRELEPSRPAPPPPGTALESAPFALVELYTSEGCSSCPPADRNLARIAGAAAREGKNVIALSFHVDYWNYLGWADPFSTAENSERQRRHAESLGGGVYTPELVLNGREQVLGSDASEADAAIARALAERPSAGIELSLARASDALVDVSYAVRAPEGELVLCIATAWGASDVRVERGENAGRTLAHANVVRSLACDPLVEAHGKRRIGLPAASSGVVVAWVEEPSSLHVLGAAAAHGS